MFINDYCYRRKPYNGVLAVIFSILLYYRNNDYTYFKIILILSIVIIMSDYLDIIRIDHSFFNVVSKIAKGKQKDLYILFFNILKVVTVISFQLYDPVFIIIKS